MRYSRTGYLEIILQMLLKNFFITTFKITAVPLIMNRYKLSTYLG